MWVSCGDLEILSRDLPQRLSRKHSGGSEESKKTLAEEVPRDFPEDYCGTTNMYPNHIKTD